MYDSFGNPIGSGNEPEDTLYTEEISTEEQCFSEEQSVSESPSVPVEEADTAASGTTAPDTTYHYVYQKPQTETPVSGYSSAEPWTTGNATNPENTAVRARTKKEKKPRRSGFTFGKAVALVVACALVGGLAGMGGASLVTKSGKASTAATTSTSTVYEGNRESTVLNVSQVDTNRLMTAAEVYAANVNSTVGITTSITTNYFGYQSTAAASGSGFIITADGYILTNYHVIEDSSSVTVTTYDNTSYEATVVGYDESNDLAVLKVDAQNLTPVVLGDSEQLNVGDSVIAIGNPLGELTFSLTAGAVSALDREVTLSSSVTMNLIQTDCAINSGNSGGALFNMYGEVIGITNAKYSSSSSSSTASIDNIGFAIPINSVRDIVNAIIEDGYLTKPYIGVSVATVTDSVMSYGLPAGASVQSVTDGAPAAEAGLQVNDIITAVNGEEITSSNDIVKIVSACKAGDKLELTVYRSGETLTLELTVGETIKSALANEADSSSTQQEQQSQSNGSNGFSFPFGNGGSSSGNGSNGFSFGY